MSEAATARRKLPPADGRPLPARYEIFGLGLDEVDQGAVVDAVVRAIDERRPLFIVTPNVDFVMLLREDATFSEVLRAADLSVCDSVPLLVAARLLAGPLPERVAGSDLFLRLSEEGGERRWRVFLMGGGAGVAEAARDVLLRRFPRLAVVGCASPAPGFEARPQENADLVARIAASGADLLFVALGTPKQERWLYANRQSLGVLVCIGVGAAFDFAVGRQRRAPRFMQRAGLEWLYRLVNEPRRLWRRYLLRDAPFVGMVVGELVRRRMGRRPRRAGRVGDASSVRDR